MKEKTLEEVAEYEKKAERSYTLNPIFSVFHRLGATNTLLIAILEHLEGSKYPPCEGVD
jgi:hypothetical protein